MYLKMCYGRNGYKKVGNRCSRWTNNTFLFSTQCLPSTFWWIPSAWPNQYRDNKRCNNGTMIAVFILIIWLHQSFKRSLRFKKVCFSKVIPPFSFSFEHHIAQIHRTCRGGGALMRGSRDCDEQWSLWLTPRFLTSSKLSSPRLKTAISLSLSALFSRAAADAAEDQCVLHPPLKITFAVDLTFIP